MRAVDQMCEVDLRCRANHVYEVDDKQCFVEKFKVQKSQTVFNEPLEKP